MWFSRGGVSSECKGVCSRLVSSLGGHVTISDVPFTPWKGAGIVLNPAQTAVTWIEFKFNSDAPELILRSVTIDITISIRYCRLKRSTLLHMLSRVKKISSISPKQRWIVMKGATLRQLWSQNKRRRILIFEQGDMIRGVKLWRTKKSS